MTMRHRVLLAAVLALVLCLSLAVVATAGAATTPTYPLTATAGAVGFDYGQSHAFAAFAARATGPAMPGEEHQPATGWLAVTVKGGPTFSVSVQHIHAHSATEVHFGGPIVKSSDPSLVGKFAHCVAIEGGRAGDQFSLLITDTDVHDHGTPAPVLYGNLWVRTPGM